MRTIDYQPYFARNIITVNPLFEDFKQRSLPRTRRYSAFEDLKELNNEYGAFITGSDQVLNRAFICNEWPVFLLGFADASKPAVCCAGSFTRSPQQYLRCINRRWRRIYRTMFNWIDALSVREEKSGKEITKKLSGLDADWILDPVFLCDLDYWHDLTVQSSCDAAHKIAVYELWPKSSLQNAVKESYPGAVCLTSDKHSPYDWLKVLSQCGFFITNSFHGACFALIFHRQFLIVSSGDSKLRMEELFNKLAPELIDRIVPKLPDNLRDYLNALPQIDYSAVDQRIAYYAQQSLSFLNKGLSTPLSDKRISEKRALMKDLRKQISFGLKCDLFKYRLKRLFSTLTLKITSSDNTAKNQEKINKYHKRMRLIKLQLLYLKRGGS